MKIVVGILLILSMTFCSAVYACNCKREQKEKRWEIADQIFYGRVVSINPFDDQTNEVVFSPYKIVKFDDAYPHKEIRIFTQASQQACGYKFQKDEDYQVFAIFEKGKNQYITTHCIGTQTMKEAEDEAKRNSEEITNGSRGK